MGIGHGFLGREGLGGDHEEGLGRVEIPGLFNKISGVDVGDEPHIRAVVKRSEGLGDHHRTEIRAADADVDDGANRPPGGAEPPARSDVVGKDPHLFEDGVDLGHDIDPVNHDRVVGAVAQGDVEHGAILGPVDGGAREHLPGRPVDTRR